MTIKALILLNNNLTVTPPSKVRTVAGSPSPFCKALNIIAQMDGDEMYMTTGFHSAYSFLDLGNSFSKNIINGFAKYSNANLRLLAGCYTDGLGKPLKNCINMMCTCGNIGTSTKKCHPKRYREFYKNMKNSLIKNKNIKVTPHIFERWHSKITFKTKESSFVALLIGSSNISSRALTRFKTSNTECDIFIYDDNYDSIVKKELASELGKTAFNLGISGIHQIGNFVQNTTDGSPNFKFMDSSQIGLNIPEEDNVLLLINEVIVDVLNCYYESATPMNSSEDEKEFQ
ncbi:TPA: hypothetical protein ACHVKB_001500 [Bacillus cereus]